MQREIKGKYLLAGVLTTLIFLLGMMLGLVIEGKRADYLQNQANSQKLDFISLQLQYQLITELSQQKNCPAVTATFESYLKELMRTEERLIEYEKDSTVGKEEFNILKKEYAQAQVNYWMLAQKTKEICSNDFITILYFYAPSEQCKDCDNQGFVLTYLKQKLKDKILIFSFDSNFKEEPLIGMLIKTFGIQEYPALVIEDKTINGFQDSDAIMKKLCPLYKEKPEACTN
jgi:hypothetical protein